MFLKNHLPLSSPRNLYPFFQCFGSISFWFGSGSEVTFDSVNRIWLIFDATRIHIGSASWYGSGSGSDQMIRIRPDPDPKHCFFCPSKVISIAQTQNDLFKKGITNLNIFIYRPCPENREKCRKVYFWKNEEHFNQHFSHHNWNAFITFHGDHCNGMLT